MGYIRGYKHLLRLSNRRCASCCVHSARVFCKHCRFETVHVRRFICVIGPFHLIRFAAVGVISNGGVLDEDKVQVCGRSNVVQIIGINGIAGIIRGFDPFSLFLLVRQAPGIFNHVSCQLQKLGNRIALFTLRGVIETDKLTSHIGVGFLYNCLNLQRFAVGHIGSQFVIYGNRMTAVRCPPARGRSVTAADHGAAVGGGTAGQGMVKLEIDVVQEVAVGFCLVSSCRGIHISNGHEAEQGFRLSCRDGVEVIFAQIHRCTAGPISTPRGACRVGAVGVPGI